jgi:hypothetical protein
MRLVPRLASFAAAAALAAVALAGPGAATATAATATLTNLYLGCDNAYGTHFDHTLRVEGTTNYYSYGMRVEVRLWGDDSSYDDFLVGPVVHYYDGWQTWYSIEVCANASTLDEDWGQDEIYAGVRVYDRSTGYLREKVESNRIYDYF